MAEFRVEIPIVGFAVVYIDSDEFDGGEVTADDIKRMIADDDITVEVSKFQIDSFYPVLDLREEVCSIHFEADYDCPTHITVDKI